MGSYAGAIAKNAAAGGGGEHGIAEAGDEVWRCSRFAQGGYKVCFVFFNPIRPDGCLVGSQLLLYISFCFFFGGGGPFLADGGFFPLGPTHTHTYLLVWD